MTDFINNFKLFFVERRKLVKNEEIFFPNNRFLYVMLLSLTFGVPYIYLLFIKRHENLLLETIEFFKLLFYELLFNPQAWLVLCPILFFLLLETSARQVAVYDGFLIQRSYFVKEEKIKIDEIKQVKITSGRNKGEAMVNLKIIGNKRGQVININMVAYPQSEIKKICELIDFPDVIKDKKEAPEKDMQKKKIRNAKTVRSWLNIIVGCTSLLFVSIIVMFMLRKLLVLNNKPFIDFISKLLVPVVLIGGFNLGAPTGKYTKRLSLKQLVLLAVLAVALPIGFLLIAR